MRIIKLVLAGIGILVLVQFVLWLTLGPQALTYLSYVIETQRTQDEIISSDSCGTVAFDVLHTDEAYRGAHASIDFHGYPPGIHEKYYLRGFVNGQRIFSELNTFPYPETYSTDRLPTVDSIEKGFVVDRSLFEKLEAAGAHGAGLGTEGRLLVFPANAISTDNLRSIAACFSKHASELSEASRWPVAAFVKLKESSRSQNFAAYDEFQCANGHKITLDSNFARLDGQTYNIIGTFTLQGYLRAWTGTGTSYGDMGMPQPIGDRVDISQWANCEDSSGETFGDFVSQTGQKIEFN